MTYIQTIGGPMSNPQPLTTVDGVVLASWGARAVARLIDNLLALVGTVLLAFMASVPLNMIGTDAFDEPPPAAVVLTLVAVPVVLLGPEFLLQVVCLRYWSTSPGRMAMRLRVRPLRHEGRLGWGLLLGRLALWVALVLAPFGLVVSYLWPLSDVRRQTLHDKAGTVVVRR